jgi:hypothetical protein
VLECLPGAQQEIWCEIAIRLAATTLQVVTALARDLGVSGRYAGLLPRPRLQLTGLAWSLVRSRLAKLLASLDSPGVLELTCAHTDSCLRVTTGRPLGGCAPLPTYLCGAVVGRRTTPAGEVLRIRSGRHEMSLALPRQISASSVSNGMVISAAPSVGRIPRRIVCVRRCQLPLFEDS